MKRLCFACALLTAALCVSPAQAALLAVLKTGPSEIHVDTVVLQFGPGPVTVPTPDFGGGAGIEDTFDFGAQSLPLAVTISWLHRSDRQDPLDIPGLRDNKWYEFPIPESGTAVIKFTVPTGIEADRANQIPGLDLDMAGPSPFSHSTAISFALPISEQIELSIINATGARIRSLVSGHCPAGRHVQTWDATDAWNHRVEPGVYFCRLTTCSAVLVRKLVLLK